MNCLSAFKNAHPGGKFIVCGCGESLNLVRERRPGCIIIGVNDVGRLFDPDYLVVLNQKNQFSRGRYTYVESSRAGAVFSHYCLSLRHSRLVQFSLGRYAGTDIEDSHSLPYTRNSPYVAVCLAAFMGAKEIGLLGVDFTDHHFFGKTGRHSLANKLDRIDQEYQNLMVSLSNKGVSLVNLSPVSRLGCLNRITIHEFLKGEGMRSSVLDRASKRYERGPNMEIQIEKYSSGLVGDFMNALASSVEALGHGLTRESPRLRAWQGDLKIVWNGRNCRNRKGIIYCEHGWLPREAYQVSHKGINADSHIAPFKWGNSLLSVLQRKKVEEYLESLRSRNAFSLEYTRTDAPGAEDLPAQFILVPLQMEHDTNIIHHVDPYLRRMQWVIDYISHADPPYPVIYKQHPADTKRGNGQLQLKLRRGIDEIRSHARGNIHQVLKSGACKGIVSLNSNVVHDGFLWDVPAVVLGRNIWSRDGVGPFIIGLPRDWGILDSFYFDPRTVACREAYIHFLMDNQWTLDDAKSPDKVDALLKRSLPELAAGHVASLGTRARRKKAFTRTINVVARNRGWLFEDLKSHFAALRVPGVHIIPSEKPVRQADAWIFLRANEVCESPDLSRTVVQIHDQYDDCYHVAGSRHILKECGAFCFTHPEQERIVRSHMDISGKPVLIKPLGASGQFQLRKTLPKKFSVAWVGRPVNFNGRDVKRVAWFGAALSQLTVAEDLAVILLGDRLSDVAKEVEGKGIACSHYPRWKYKYSQYPNAYSEMDCLVITSEFAAGPNCLFEALATGVPVIATPCGWVETLIRNGDNGYIVTSPSDIAATIESIRANRELWFSRRSAIRESAVGLSLERWLEENVALAASLPRFRSNAALAETFA